MSIELQGEIVIREFQTQSNGMEAGWSLRINRQDKFAVIKLHWTDKESATHVAFADLESFKRMVASL